MTKFGGYERSGRHLSVWIPNRDEWLFEKLEERTQAREFQGKPSSIGEEVRKILKKELKREIDVESS